ncbi:hypothetical protein SFRURICE_014708 [Spodoptera frugiperda]|nr:hypothetical protein SFRURICE_014708 [Spodoptera frugiperda]
MVESLTRLAHYAGDIIVHSLFPHSLNLMGRQTKRGDTGPHRTHRSIARMRLHQYRQGLAWVGYFSSYGDAGEYSEVKIKPNQHKLALYRTRKPLPSSRTCDHSANEAVN